MKALTLNAAGGTEICEKFSLRLRLRGLFTHKKALINYGWYETCVRLSSLLWKKIRLEGVETKVNVS